jgi:phosphatidylinositol alpha-mannosyltransferase
MVTEYAYPILGGVSEHVHFLSRELVALGHDVTVVTGSSGSAAELAELDRAAERDDGYRTIRIGRAIPVPSNGSIARITLVPGYGALRRLLDGHDVVHAQGLAGSMLPLAAVAQSQAPVTVGTFHTYIEGDTHWAYRVFQRQLTRWLGRLDRRIGVSQACIDRLMPPFPGEYDVIPNGVDCDRFRPLRADEPRPPGPPRILFVGRLEPRNALGDLLKAGAELASSGRDFVIQVAGDGPTRGVNERLAERLGIAGRVEWLGRIHDDLPRRYREATVFAAPCTLASFGVILVEALASGTPIVCADNVGFRAVIRDGMPGRFTPMRDPNELARGLAEVLDDSALRAEWSTRGRALTAERYDWPGVALQVEALYHEVRGDRAAGLPATAAPSLAHRAVG